MNGAGFAQPLPRLPNLLSGQDEILLLPREFLLQRRHLSLERLGYLLEAQQLPEVLRHSRQARKRGSEQIADLDTQHPSKVGCFVEPQRTLCSLDLRNRCLQPVVAERLHRLGEGGLGQVARYPYLPDVIKAWWLGWPSAMIGAKVPDNSLVLDCDPRNGGDLEKLVALVGDLPPTLTVWSGRNDGGQHLYYQRPTGPLTSTRLPEGIDLKVNGYCIVPPSIHPATGQLYRWESRTPATLPSRLQELLTPLPPRPIARSGSNASAIGLLRAVVGAPEGNRNKVLYWASCRAAESGILDNQVEALLINAAVAAGETETKARRTVASARRKTS